MIVLFCCRCVMRCWSDSFVRDSTTKPNHLQKEKPVALRVFHSVHFPSATGLRVRL